MPSIKNTTSRKISKHSSHEAAPGVRINSGPFVGIVKNNIDPMRSGRLQVWISELGGAVEDPTSWRTVAYCTPFYGATSSVTRGKKQGFTEGSPHSYGMWAVPPDVGIKVLCTFVNGDPFRGYWFACIPEWPNVHMLPGIASGSWYGAGPEPLVEFNAEDPAFNTETFYKANRATHAYQTQVWQRQGLLQDPHRGPGTSSAFRESPSRVFGISTPGPELAIPLGADPDAVAGSQTADINVRARQGGHQFVMDDGDANGNSQLIRLRTSNGNMLLMNDSAGIVYMINAKGNAWFELDGAGNVRIFSGGKFEVHGTSGITLETPGPLKLSGSTVDVEAKGPLNLSGATANLKGTGSVKVGGMGTVDIAGMKVGIGGMMGIGLKSMMHIDLKGTCITLNTKSPMMPMPPMGANGGQGPTHEPYGGHSNSKTSSAPGTQSYAAPPGTLAGEAANNTATPSNSPAVAVVSGGNSTYGAANGLIDGVAGSYGAASSFGATANIPKFYGVVTNQNGPIKFNPGLQGSLAGQAANLGDAATYNVYDVKSTPYQNAVLNLPISRSGFAINIQNADKASIAGLSQGEALNNPGMIKDRKFDPFAIGQINGLNVYSTPEEGIAALTLMLDLVQAGGAKTVADFIQGYVSRKGKTT
jgi:hypothetical protein